MTWTQAEAALRLHIETQWALGSFAAMPLAWENEDEELADRYMAVNIEGTFADKTLYGSTGKRSSVEGGIVFFHAFTPTGRGKSEALGAVVAMSAILELRTVASSIKLEGAAPPYPVSLDRETPARQPGGMYFRCSGSVPFIVIGTR